MPINFFKASGAQIDIQLDNPSGPYYPGDEIHAVIALRGEKELKVRRFQAGLKGWEQIVTQDSDGDQTTYNTIDQLAVQEVLMEDETITSGTYRSFRVDLQIPPDAFPAYNSAAIRSNWQVNAVIDLGLKRDISESLILPLVVPPPGLKIEAGEYGQASHPDDVQMLLGLSKLEWVAGDQIEGKLQINPRRKFDAREVRVQLVRREHVRAARIRISNTDCLDRVRIDAKTHFQKGQPREFPFIFTIPQNDCPTRDTQTSTVSYFLQGVLSRRMRKDYTVSMEIEIYNGHAPK